MVRGGDDDDRLVGFDRRCQVAGHRLRQKRVIVVKLDDVHAAHRTRVRLCRNV
jgi:hypothetical protein